MNERLHALSRRVAEFTTRLTEHLPRGTGTWERDLMQARYAIPRLPSGPQRAAALDSYIAWTLSAQDVIVRADDIPRATREVLRALRCERRLLATEALGPRERAMALEANAHAWRACHSGATADHLAPGEIVP